ncbi:MAG: Mitochondrial ATPase complex subunit atp10 [Claussenomyces sp. TS43310]|nr:MAG: Mitochondrial ATPase complex subunit atp10 [Claussenomyces sp. TS43310]
MQMSRRCLRSSRASIELSDCLVCQRRLFSSSYVRRTAKGVPPPQAIPPAAPTPSSLDEAPRAYGKAVQTFSPKPLNRPIGIPNPPEAGENSGIDRRTWRQRRDDFLNYDKHLARRKELTEKISTPYFREWSNMRHHKGKSFLAPPRLFKSDRALYFPNFQGQTLAKGQYLQDTTVVLRDRVSVVSVFSSAWAERQVASFTTPKNNLELHRVIHNSGGIAQMVQINIEENALKALLIKLFIPNLRRTMDAKDWGKYFLVRRGISTAMRDTIGLLNSKVGYTYLIDGSCKIRWAGSGICEGDEKESLVKGVRRLIEEG